MRYLTAISLGLLLCAAPLLATAQGDPPAAADDEEDPPPQPSQDEDDGAPESSLPSAVELLQEAENSREEDKDDKNDENVETKAAVQAGGSEEEPAPISDPLVFVDADDDHFVILEVSVPGIILTRELPGYFDGDRLLIPLWAFVELVEFPIDVDLEEARASGWFQSPEHSFELDLEERQATVAGRDYELKQGDLERHIDDIYVDMEVLSRWFFIDYEFSYSLMRLMLDPREPLPAQRRQERAQRQKNIRDLAFDDEPGYAVVPTPYQLATRPVHDVRFDAALPTSHQARNNDRVQRNVPQSNSYQVRGAGDLFFMNAYWSITGNELHPISRTRFHMERKDPRGQLLGPMEATEVAAGDVISPSIPLIARSSRGRGAQVSSFPLNRPSAFDFTSISGQKEPGWEIELYRNDVLIDFEDDSSLDYYHFHEVPLVFGMNEIRVIHYGPHGEEFEELHEYYIGPDMITPGEGYYRVSVSQHNTEMLPIGSFHHETEVDGRPRAVVEYEHGIFEKLAVAGRLNTMPLNDGRQRLYATAGVRNSYDRFYNSVDLIVGDGLALQGAVQTRIRSLNLVAESAQFFADFTSERFSPTTHPVRNRSQLRLNGVVPTADTLRVPFSLILRNDYLSERGNRTRLSNRLSTRLYGISVVHNLRINSPPRSSPLVSGSLSARRRTRLISPRAELSYGINGGVRAYRFGFDWRITSDLQARGDMLHQFGDRHNLTLRSGISHRVRRFTWGADVGLSRQGGLSAGVTISTGIGHNPQTDKWELSSNHLTSSGTVMPRVFWDKSQNGVFDEAVDEPLPEAKFIVNNTRQADYETDGTGLAVVSNLPTEDFVDVKVERRSLYDPFFVPEPEGHSVVPRPGAPTYLDFPVVMTGEIDGTIRIERDGVLRPLANMELQLVDADGEIVDERTTAFDGFYLFDFIRPGTYTLRISADLLARRNLEIPEDRQIEIDVDGTIVSGQNFEVRALEN